MRIITNPFFGAGKKARDLYFVNQDISVFLTTASFSSKLSANNMIYVKTNFGNTTWENTILVKDQSNTEVFGKPLFLYKHQLGRFEDYPKGKYTIRVKVVKHIVVSAVMFYNEEIVDTIGSGAVPKKGLSFPTQEEQRKYFDMLKTMTFSPDIIIDNPHGEKSDHLTSTEIQKRDAYYTPDALADIMADYLAGAGPVLDPFCGKGSLLEAAVRKGKVKESDIYGWDIDGVAIDYCRKKFPKGSFEVKDSLHISP